MREKGSYLHKSGIIGGAISLTVATLVVKILGVIYKVPLSYILGDEGMGYFNSAYTVYSFFYLICTAGVPKAIMISVSEREAGGRMITKIASRSYLTFGGFVTLIFLLSAGALSRLIGSPASAYTMLAVAPSVIFISVGGVLRGYLSARHRFLSVAVSQIIEGAGKLVFGLFFALIGFRLCLPLYVISALTILGVSLGAIFALVYLSVLTKRENKKDSIEVLAVDRDERRGIMKRIFAVSFPITLSAAVMSATNILDLLLIMKGLVASGVSGETATALYGNYTTMAVPMLNLAISIITPISIAYIPTFTRAYINNRKELEGNIADALRLTAFVSAPVSLGMIIYSREILALLFDDNGARVGAPLLRVLAVGFIFFSALLIVNSALEASGAVRVPVYAMTVGCIFKLISSFILIRNDSYGILGAPIGTVLCYAVGLISALLYGSIKCKARFPIIAAYFKPMLLAFFSVSLSRLVFYPVCEGLGESAGTLAAVGFSALLYLALSLAFGMSKSLNFGKRTKYTKLPESI